MKEIVIGSKPTLVGKSIGKGGEGEVFEIRGNRGLAVKIYNPKLRSAREDKIRAMVKEGLASKTELIAYPGDIAFDKHGSFVGFLMHLVSGYRPIHELYSPKSRQTHFQKADYRFIIRSALNVARAIAKVHQTGCIIGDLNHSGVLVAQDATVALIDADSFQFSIGSKMYPCVVGVPDFTPPELHGADLKKTVRTIEHDNFGLAVAIFHLLFMGRHPYAGRHKGPDISMGEAIAQNRFAFSLERKNTTKTSPPPGALTLDVFPDIISNAFEKAFGTNPNYRPNAPDWVNVLSQLEGSLNRCSAVKAHFYPSAAKNCIWCDLSGKSGFDMFPDLLASGPDIRTDSLGTEQAIREILSFAFPSAADVLPAPPSQPRGQSQTLTKALEAKNRQGFMGGALIAVAAAVLAFAAPLWFIWIPLAWWGWSIISNRSLDSAPFTKTFLSADEQVQRSLDSFIQRNGLSEIIQVYSDLKAAISSYKKHDEELATALRKLKSTREERQRTAYLDTFPIRSAKISGIGPAKTATLISFGIETAADVTWNKVDYVPGFGDVMTSKLVDWRQKIESRFKYNPMPNAQDAADERALRTRFASEKLRLETTIRNGLAAIRGAKTKFNGLQVRARNDRELLGAIQARAQAEYDLKTLGASIPTSNVAIKVSAPPASSSSTSPPSGSYTQASSSSGTPACPNCGKKMTRRTARRGRNRGNQFWGCSSYPYCKGTRNI